MPNELRSMRRQRCRQTHRTMNFPRRGFQCPFSHVTARADGCECTHRKLRCHCGGPIQHRPSSVRHRRYDSGSGFSHRSAMVYRSALLTLIHGVERSAKQIRRLIYGPMAGEIVWGNRSCDSRTSTPGIPCTPPVLKATLRRALCDGGRPDGLRSMKAGATDNHDGCPLAARCNHSLRAVCSCQHTESVVDQIA